MVDYSKWDKLAADLSDEEADDDGDDSRTPSVTKFDKPRSLTIANNQVKMRESSATSASASTTTKKTPATNTTLSNFVPATSAESSARSSSSASTSANAAGASSKKEPENYTLNGADCGDFMWMQTRDAVQLAIPVPAGTKARSVAVHVESKALSVTLDSRSILSCALAYAVDASEDAVSGCWRIVDDTTNRDSNNGSEEKQQHQPQPRRLILVNLSKKVDVPGLVLWWSTVRAGDKPIDVTAIKERQQKGGNAPTFAQVWDEAHKEFLQRVKNRPPPQEIDVPSTDDDALDEDASPTVAGSEKPDVDAMQQDAAQQPDEEKRQNNVEKNDRQQEDNINERK